MPLPDSPQTIELSSARDTIYRLLREWILSGPLEPEEELRDVRIATLFGVSRTPVREALLTLGSEGLVVTAKGRSTRVAPLRLDQAANLYRVVAALDALAAEQSALSLGRRELEAMEEANERLRTAQTPDGFSLADLAFHSVYRKTAGNPIAIKVLDDVLFEIRRLERAYFRDPVATASSYEGHRAILEAFRERDPARAAEAARENFLSSIARMLVLSPMPHLDRPSDDAPTSAVKTSSSSGT